MKNVIGKIRQMKSSTSSFGLLRSFLKRQEGASAVEFALVAPLFTTMYFGVLAMAAGDHSASRVEQVASTVSDIISQSAGLSAAQIDGALMAAEAIAGSNNAAAMEIEAIGVNIDSNRNATVVWSRDSQGGQPYPPGSPYSVPASLLNQPGFVVASRTAMSFTPPVGGSLLPSDGAIPLEYKYYYVPRVSSSLFCPDC